jgi:hypothetical protein
MSDGNEIDDLDEYYKELGIDPLEMRPAKAPKAEYVTREKKESAE